MGEDKIIRSVGTMAERLSGESWIHREYTATDRCTIKVEEKGEIFWLSPFFCPSIICSCIPLHMIAKSYLARKSEKDTLQESLSKLQLSIFKLPKYIFLSSSFASGSFHKLSIALE